MRADLDRCGPFGLHMSDPAWETRDKLPGERGAAYKYKVMSTDAICNMSTPPMKRDSVLILWRLGAMVEDAIRVARAWGFKPKSEIVWNKRRRCGPCDGTGRSKNKHIGVEYPCESCEGRGDKPHQGLGHYVAYSHEVAIIAVRGRPQRITEGIRSSFEARMPEHPNGKPIHSAKPPEIYDLLERLYPGPYVETFARNSRPGWLGLGDQLDEVARG